ncbi:hypothetical protein DPMN_066819 [Dreissena polymorpha]|uniref:Myosin motor domain-containing protein n=1 Tax=Dreissena polymorpha TaxID=45954 RepID=A0A9D3YUS3_DREPO|nr:hypothetical protein DPMN_066819 [Dreissena polymorpha]
MSTVFVPHKHDDYLLVCHSLMNSCAEDHHKQSGEEHTDSKKSRVTYQQSAENNYHIFYQMLTNVYPKYHVLVVDGIDDTVEMKATDVRSNVACTAAILHFGEMKWKQNPREEQAEADEAEKVAFLLGINSGDLLKGLLKPKIKVGTEFVVQGRNKEQVINSVAPWPSPIRPFEKLCINYTNERLQQFFNHHMIVLEQEEYKKEGIQWEFIDFGTIQHLWLARQEQGSTEQDCRRSARRFKGTNCCLLIHVLFRIEEEAGGGKKKGKSTAFRTISALNRESLNKLIKNLYNTHPHFVRCIIPNELKTPGLIDAGLVLNQLQCNGVLAGIRICRKGFPSRVLYAEFKQRYSILAPNAILTGFVDGKVVTEKILTAI